MAQFQPWANPDPQSVAGLNSQMVYGENIQFAVGLNHQVALGSNLQLCINPGALMDLLNLPGSSTLSGMFGSGLGGNMQFTIGTSTNVVWGRQFQVNMGPEQITIDANSHRPFTAVMCILIGAACVAYPIAYGLCRDEDERAALVIAFQGMIDLLLSVFMMHQMYYKSLEKDLNASLQQLFGMSDAAHTNTLEGFAMALELVAILGAAIAPPVAIAVEEGHFQGDKQDSSS